MRIPMVEMKKDGQTVKVNAEDAEKWEKDGWKKGGAVKADGDAPALSKMKKADLIALAEEKGVDLGDAGTKEEIIAVLEAADAAGQ